MSVSAFSSNLAAKIRGTAEAFRPELKNQGQANHMSGNAIAAGADTLVAGTSVFRAPEGAREAIAALKQRDYPCTRN